MNLLVDVVKRLVADFTADREVDIVAIGETTVSVEIAVASRSSTTNTDSTNSSSAVVEVALGTFKEIQT